MPVEPTRPRPKRHLSRKDDIDYRFEGIHAREVEQKRNRGEISCAECRRLKIKCDKQIPCQSCQRRGCASLCPNSSLETGQGTRFVIAATEHLHDRIAKMGARIRKLEDALVELQAKHSIEPHPLLRDEMLDGPAEGNDDLSGVDDMDTKVQNQGVVDALGTLEISDRGISRFFGPTGGSESLFMAIDTKLRSSLPSLHNDDNSRGSKSPPDSGFFSRSFPFTPIGPMADTQSIIETRLPPVDRAYFLCKRYYTEVAWIFRLVPKSQVYDDLLPFIYGNTSTYSLDSRSPHELSLIFSIFAIGALVDEAVEEAEHYHQIAQAAINLQSVLEKPSLETIQSLRLWSIYNGMNDSSETSMEMTWSLATLAVHLSYTIGLHRDSERWGLSPQMVQRRRAVFWDLFMADVWQSLHTGRPPAVSMEYVDCGLPEQPTSEDPATVTDAEFESWLYRFASECAAEVLSRTLTAEGPRHATIMDLDRKIREFRAPETGSFASLVSDTSDVGLSMRRLTMVQCREAILLYIHRGFFAQAVIDHPTNPLLSSYTRSFLATYSASSNILRSMQEAFTTWPKSCSRYWVMSTFAFSASVVFGIVVIRCPASPLAVTAMKELEQACSLFNKAATYGRRFAKSLPILLRLREKARFALGNTRMQSTNPKGDQILQSMELGDTEDELALFAGRKGLVSSQRNPPTPADSYSPQPSFQTYNPPNDYSSRSSQSLSPPESGFSDTPHMEAVSPTKMWVTEQARSDLVSTPEGYHSSRDAAVSQFSPQQPSYPLNVAWSSQEAIERPPGGAGAMYDVPSSAGPYRGQEHNAYAAPSSSYQSIRPQLSNQELASLGFTSQEASRFHDRWTAFMHDSGVLDGITNDFRGHR